LTFRDTLLHVAEYQHNCLDLLAFYEWVTTIRERLLLRAEGDEPYEVDPTWMGAFTDDPIVLQRLFAVGVPVWYIRPKSSLTIDTVIDAHVSMSKPT
ncbi:hypothetical protein BV22DRAFT_998448, partial [Leucogyrophana mollusca]